ncbi:pantothenate kinase [Alteribacillus persepolensis]|uniref:Pantothenate kinase n=1 Tax=Alteribacillus persepolensis TaxID=568899 RepID=A0A1G8FK69_9BACI|nr:type II pantothenate kinase [Alteribacillus persepolensis]SDH82511.1 pantothenate kinase [Alteribacillus persepolensis]
MNKEYLGVDVGGTLSKIVYRLEGEWRYKKVPTTRLEDVDQWIQGRFHNPVIHITGGKAGLFTQKSVFPVKKINEFEATCEGVRHLLEENGQYGEAGSRFMVTNVGTGTSIHVVEGDSYERIGGSGMGGGTLLGLSYLLTGEDNYDTILTLGKQGNGASLNVTVRDIYSHENPPISGDLTASNFGNVSNMKEQSFSQEDYIAAVVRMIGETITTMSVQAAERLKTDTVVYIGSTFSQHDTLRDIVQGYTELRGKKALFLDHGEYSGAIGAFLNKGLKKAVL